MIGEKYKSSDLYPTLFIMVAFILHLLGWLACALFWFFVIGGTSYSIYKLIKDKIDEKKVERIAEKQQEKYKKEMEEAKERISKLAEQERKNKIGQINHTGI